MKIYTYYDDTPNAPPHQAELIRIWQRSWSARGWEPQLLTPRHARRSKFYVSGNHLDYPLCALDAATKGKGWLVPPNVINFSLPVTAKRRLAGILPFGATGWHSCGLIEFPRHFSMQDILCCGRPVRC